MAVHGQPGTSRTRLVSRIIVYLVLIALATPALRGSDRPSHGALLARITATTLRLARVPAIAVNDVVSGAGFSMAIAPVCDGVDLAAILGLAILLAPAPWRWRAAGTAAAICLTQIFNIGRLLCMFVVGAYFPEHFELFHQILWQAAAITFCVALYAVWLSLAPVTVGES